MPSRSRLTRSPTRPRSPCRKGTRPTSSSSANSGSHPRPSSPTCWRPDSGRPQSAPAQWRCARRRTLATTYATPTLDWTPLSGAERHATFTLVAAALAAWLAPLLGLAPWWPFTAVVAVSLLLRRERSHLSIPWRIGAQVAGLLVATQALALRAPAEPAHRLAGLLAIALGVGAASALANNVPVSASATALLTAGPAAYAASIGLAVGALATPQGSVATLIATDLAGPNAPALPVRRLAPLAAAAVLVATLVFWATLRV
jgi:hypothetical protein